jgi:hypothetical protein
MALSRETGVEDEAVTLGEERCGLARRAKDDHRGASHGHAPPMSSYRALTLPSRNRPASLPTGARRAARAGVHTVAEGDRQSLEQSCKFGTFLIAQVAEQTLFVRHVLEEDRLDEALSLARQRHRRRLCRVREPSGVRWRCGGGARAP